MPYMFYAMNEPWSRKFAGMNYETEFFLKCTIKSLPALIRNSKFVEWILPSTGRYLPSGLAYILDFIGGYLLFIRYYPMPDRAQLRSIKQI